MSGFEEAYEAATTATAVFDRSDRVRLRVWGRAPGQMLNGVLTGTIPPAPAPAGEGLVGGEATYHCALTPKGKMISDLWLLRRGEEEGPGYLLDVPAAGRDGLLADFSRYLPPRFARVEDVTREVGALTVTGPGSGEALSRLALGLRVGAEELAGLPEGGWRAASRPEGGVADALVVARTADVDPEAYHVAGPPAAVRALRASLQEGGATEAGADVWRTLRVEAGRPEFGVDMDEGTIPVEAGIHDRAIDYRKGCYTGQEVIVRIRDRGKVNRSLRRLQLGDVPPPDPGTELFAVGEDGAPGARPVGRITSAVRSPRFGETVALAYVRTGVERVAPGG